MNFLLQLNEKKSASLVEKKTLFTLTKKQFVAKVKNTK